MRDNISSLSCCPTRKSLKSLAHADCGRIVAACHHAVARRAQTAPPSDSDRFGRGTFLLRSRRTARGPKAMIRARCRAVLLACTMTTPAAAQQATTAPPPVAQAGNKAPGPDIVVQGLKDRKRGTWRRADGAHIIVYSKGSADELVRVTRNIERLHQLLTRLYRRGGGADDMVRPQITLLDPDTDLSSLGLQNARWQQGPFMAPFAGTVYYDPREDGEVMAVSRRDTSIKLNTVRAFNEDCDDVVQYAGTDAVGLCSKMAPHRNPLGVAWERSLYAAYAERFILTYAPASDPRWYLDGIGALFSSIAIRPDGAIDYARVPDQFQQVLTAYGPADVAGVLTGRYLTDTGDAARWSPYHAWLRPVPPLYGRGATGQTPCRSRHRLRRPCRLAARDRPVRAPRLRLRPWPGAAA
ncbi:hypothetical protein WR25_17535 [Diploscapter pachys]|uniref:Uncharacterized protein n=1 Tax=Diploscapter pachys TaxID=2018661 RepID=A0A2A2M2P7_9BILA|nr:hypothetical protein WR25_17535 [Diploscapter pachys]